MDYETYLFDDEVYIYIYIYLMMRFAFIFKNSSYA